VNKDNAEGLNKTLKSIDNQIDKRFEYIVIDAASKDDSVSLLEKSGQMIDQWVSESDRGIYDGMNKGIAKASGKYLLFLNSGDILYESITTQRFLTGNYQEDLIYGDLIFRSETEKGKLSDVCHNYPKDLNFSFFYTSSLGHPSTFIKKSLLVNSGGYSANLKIVSDWEFFAREICLNKATFKKIDGPIAIFYTDGISSQKYYQNVISEERDHVLENVFPSFKDDYKLMELEKRKFHQINRYLGPEIYVVANSSGVRVILKHIVRAMALIIKLKAKV